MWIKCIENIENIDAVIAEQREHIRQNIEEIQTVYQFHWNNSIICD